ncbi:hypothetical protein SPSYN_02996 [Sporotomaculum syntrophicum]|uniref:Uncharacterized protein n=1 Tax=Sporotomaculum syntrophicum TaxID=182264 RepID=A0A9D2WMQ9_9FIRM|nr:hypothetical protein SPSYN_02996 [Sporotomaculum syntrophicum]
MIICFLKHIVTVSLVLPVLAVPIVVIRDTVLNMVFLNTRGRLDNDNYFNI